jgi:preprotein translocase subunit SecA
MKRFASWLMEKALGEADDMPIESGMVSKAIERAQKQVEAQNFSIRKQLLEYDDVQNKQRHEVYALRREVLDGGDQREFVMTKARELLEELVDEHIPADPDVETQPEELAARVLHFYGFDPAKEGIEIEELGRPDLLERLWETIERRYQAKEQHVGLERMRDFERYVILQLIDHQWKDHLLALDHLKEGIHLRAYAQKDPKIEYKRESFELFGEMKQRIEDELVRYLMIVQIMSQEEQEREEERRRREQEAIFQAASRSRAGEEARQAQTVKKKEGTEIGRNEPCPCGSGKKYKKCHGAVA